MTPAAYRPPVSRYCRFSTRVESLSFTGHVRSDHCGVALILEAVGVAANDDGVVQLQVECGGADDAITKARPSAEGLEVSIIGRCSQPVANQLHEQVGAGLGPSATSGSRR